MGIRVLSGMVLLAAATQPCQAYLMGREGLPIRNAAFRNVAAQAIQPASVPIPEMTLRSLQTQAAIGGMVTNSRCGRCVEASQRNGIDLSCGEFTVLAAAAAAAAAAAEEEERMPITGWLDGLELRGDSGGSVVSPRSSSAPVGGLQRLGYRRRLGLAAAAPVRARVVAQAAGSQALGGWAGRGKGGGTSPPAGGGGPPPGGGPPGRGPGA